MKKKMLDELVNFFAEEVKNLPDIERRVNLLLEKIDSRVVVSDDWADSYQKISEIELNAKKILETLTPLTEVPVGLGDAFILLRLECDKAKKELMENRGLEEGGISNIEVNRKNFVSRVRNFIKDLEAREKKNLRRILTVLDENRRLKRRILELRVENEKLREKQG